MRQAVHHTDNRKFLIAERSLVQRGTVSEERISEAEEQYDDEKITLFAVRSMITTAFSVSTAFREFSFVVESIGRIAGRS